MLDSSHLIVSGIDATTPNNLHYYKVTFGTQTVNWATKMLWGSSSWSVGLSEILVDSANTYLYNFSIFGASVYLHFVILNASSGALVGSHYISSTTCSNVYGSAQYGGYIIANAYCSGYKVVIFSANSNAFTICNFSETLYGAAYDVANGM